MHMLENNTINKRNNTSHIITNTYGDIFSQLSLDGRCLSALLYHAYYCTQFSWFESLSSREAEGWKLDEALSSVGVLEESGRAVEGEVGRGDVQNFNWRRGREKENRIQRNKYHEYIIQYAY